MPSTTPFMNLSPNAPPNQALQRAAFGIKCSAAGGRTSCTPVRFRAHVLIGRRAVAELCSWAARNHRGTFSQRKSDIGWVLVNRPAAGGISGWCELHFGITKCDLMASIPKRARKPLRATSQGAE